MTQTLRAALYRRVSTVRQAEEGYSLADQDRQCERYVRERLQAAIAGRFADTDSGAGWDLPGLNAMLDAAKRHEFDVLVVFDPDRLARNMAKQLTLESELRRLGVAIHYAKFQFEDTSEGRLQKNMLAAFAEYEREKIAFRTANGLRNKTDSGKVAGTGPAPYGYRYTYDELGKVKGLQEDPDTAPTLRRIFRDLVRKSVLAVCRDLNEEGLPPPTTVNGLRKRPKRPQPEGVPPPEPKPRKRQPPLGVWSPPTIRGMLANPVYLGIATFRRHDNSGAVRDESEWIKVAVPPLVTSQEWQAAHDACTERKTRRQARHVGFDPFLLRGLLRCAYCGGALACLPNTGHRYYACLRSQPEHAKRQGKPVCSLPDARGDPFAKGELPGAYSLEEIAWDAVTRTLLNERHLRKGLEAARREHEQTAQMREQRFEGLARDIEWERRRLRGHLSDKNDPNAGPETRGQATANVAESEKRIARLLASRAELEAQQSPGLSAAEVVALTDFAAEVKAGIRAAKPEERRRIYEFLRLRGAVRLARDGERGYRLGRRLRRYVVEWEAVIPLSTSNSRLNLENFELSFYSTGRRLEPLVAERAAV